MGVAGAPGAQRELSKEEWIHSGAWVTWEGRQDLFLQAYGCHRRARVPSTSPFYIPRSPQVVTLPTRPPLRWLLVFSALRP